MLEPSMLGTGTQEGRGKKGGTASAGKGRRVPKPRSGSSSEKDGRLSGLRDTHLSRRSKQGYRASGNGGGHLRGVSTPLATRRGPEALRRPLLRNFFQSSQPGDPSLTEASPRTVRSRVSREHGLARPACRAPPPLSPPPPPRRGLRAGGWGRVAEPAPPPCWV